MKKTKKAVLHLSTIDPILGAAIARIKLPYREQNKNYFYALARAIIRQQLSGKAADSIERKYVALFKTKDFPSPKQVLAMPMKKMRSAGLSGSKAGSIKNMARAVHTNKLKLQELETLPNEIAVEKLVAIKGIGQWTAEMFLMFAVGRPDIFSYGDLGLRNAIQRMYKLRKHPSKEKAEKIAAKWSPHRTLACRFLWASLEIEL